MAITITTKFYEQWDEASPNNPEAGEWHDLNKIVFTSPNIDSPSSAGTRSNVLPGQLQPALWYEDTSNMYLVETTQGFTDESYQGATTSGLAFSAQNSIVFEVTQGEAYNFRLTAWDDVTHSTTSSEMLDGEYVRASAVAYYTTNSGIIGGAITEVHAPSYNFWMKGNSTVSGTNAYYGDFNLNYHQPADEYGDYLIFKPMLIGLNASTPYGVHDFVVTLHYTYA